MTSTMSELRTVATPAATMRTYASPSTEPPADVAVWRTELPAGTAGPLHSIDRDHVVVVVEGTVDVLLGGEQLHVPSGASIVLPAGVPRRIAAAAGSPAVTVTSARPDSRATVGDGEPVEVPWAR